MALGGRFDFVAGLAVPLPVIVICELLGVPAGDRPDVRRWSGELFAAGNPDAIDAASHSLADYMTALIAAKRLDPGDSRLDGLIAARDGDDRLSEEELVSLAVLLLVAGHETTTNFLGNAALALLQRPRRAGSPRERIPDAVPAVPGRAAPVRLPREHRDLPVHHGTRHARRTEIPAGAPVQIALGAADRDPARFPAPDRLDLDRDAAAHLSFGHGIHRCVGAPLAKAEAEIALRAVLSRFPGHPAGRPTPTGCDWRHTRLGPRAGVASRPGVAARRSANS